MSQPREAEPASPLRSADHPVAEAPTGAEASGPDGEAAGAERSRLEALREEIEQVDRRLIELIAERVELARQVGRAKHRLGLPTLDPAREAAVVRNAGALAREIGLEDEDVRYIFWHLIGLTRRAQLAEE